MSTLVLARSQGHSVTSDCTHRSGEIGIDKMCLMPQWRRVCCIPMGVLYRAPAAQRSHTKWRDTQNNLWAPGSRKHNLVETTHENTHPQLQLRNAISLSLLLTSLCLFVHAHFLCISLSNVIVANSVFLQELKFPSHKRC